MHSSHNQHIVHRYSTAIQSIQHALLCQKKKHHTTPPPPSQLSSPAVTRRRHIAPLPPTLPVPLFHPLTQSCFPPPSIFPLFAIEGGPPPPFWDRRCCLASKPPNRPSSTLPCPCLMSPSFVISLSASPFLPTRHSSHDTAAGGEGGFSQPFRVCKRVSFNPTPLPSLPAGHIGPSSTIGHWPPRKVWPRRA